MKFNHGAAWLGLARTHFQRYSARERKALLLLAASVITAVCVQIVWTVESQRRMLQRQIPLLAGQVEHMRQLAAAWRSMASENAATPEGVRTENDRSAIDQSLVELGSGIEAQWTAGGALTLKGEADFATWLRWTATMHKVHRLALERCRLHAVASGVAIEATFAFPSTAR